MCDGACDGMVQWWLVWVFFAMGWLTGKEVTKKIYWEKIKIMDRQVSVLAKMAMKGTTINKDAI